jgi:hypothetical protein
VPAVAEKTATRRGARVVLGNRDARNLLTVSIDAALARHHDEKDPATIWGGLDGDGLPARRDDTAGLANLSEPVRGKRAVIAVLPDDRELSLDDAYTAFTAKDGVWSNQTHSDDSRPAWVASDWPELAQRLAAHWWGTAIRDIDEDEVAATFGEAHAR